MVFFNNFLKLEIWGIYGMYLKFVSTVSKRGGNPGAPIFQL